MKKALIVSLSVGFLRSFLENDVLLLQKRGYKVCFAGHATNRKGNAEFLEDHGIDFYEVEFAGRKPYSSENRKALNLLRRLIKKEKFSVIHCHTPVVGVLTKLACMLSGKRKDCKLIYTSHGFYFHKGAPRSAWVFYYPIEYLASKLCDAIITINKEDYRIAQHMLCKAVFHIHGVGMDRSRFVKNEINRDVYRENIGLSADELVVLSVGELSARKNHAVLIRALAKADIPRSALVLCGNAAPQSDMKERLKVLADELKVRVLFLGYREDIPEIAHCADIGALPSKREGLGMAGVEMLTAGIPVVASNIHGIMDYMQDGVNGFVVDPEDVDGFAEALIKLSDPECRKQMRDACIRSTEPFDKAVSRSQMDAIYTAVLEN